MGVYTQHSSDKSKTARILLKVDLAKFVGGVRDATQKAQICLLHKYLQSQFALDDEEAEMLERSFLLHRINSERKLLELAKLGYDAEDVDLAAQFEEIYNCIHLLPYSHSTRMLTSDGTLQSVFRLPSGLLLGEECKEDLDIYFKNTRSFSGVYVAMTNEGDLPDTFESCEDVKSRPVLFKESTLVETFKVTSVCDVNKKRKLE